MRFLKYYGTIGFITDTLYQYRYHELSLTRTKEKFINQQLLSYRMSQLEWILKKLEKRPDLITKMYCEFIGSEQEMYFLVQACEFVPELKLLMNKEKHDQYIIWGAGQYGRKALETLKNKVYCFADQNPDMIGQEIGGKKIISYNDMMSLSQKEICIAVSDEKVYMLLSDLYHRGVSHCKIIQEFLKGR